MEPRRAKLSIHGSHTILTFSCCGCNFAGNKHRIGGNVKPVPQVRIRESHLVCANLIRGDVKLDTCVNGSCSAVTWPYSRCNSEAPRVEHRNGNKFRLIARFRHGREFIREEACIKRDDNVKWEPWAHLEAKPIFNPCSDIAEPRLTDSTFTLRITIEYLR